MSYSKRKIIQVSASVTTVNKVDEYTEYEAAEPYLVALCNDGTVWEYNEFGNWNKLPDIPQDNDCPEVRIVEGTLGGLTEIVGLPDDLR